VSLTDVAEGRVLWRVFANTVMNIRVPQNSANISTG